MFAFLKNFRVINDIWLIGLYSQIAVNVKLASLVIRGLAG